MTFITSKENFADRFLALLDKKRAVRLPVEVYQKLGPYIYAKAEKESFWCALFRNKNQNHPAGWIYPVK